MKKAGNEFEGYPMNSGDQALLLLACLFAGLLVIANVLAVKPVPIGSTIVVPAAVIAYALTFPITDAVTEIWGRERANALIWSGFVASLLAAALVRLALVMPWAPFWPMQEAFQAILGANLRIVAASMAAYLVSQLHDVWAFSFWRQRTGGKYLWLRNNLSTMVSQMLDTVIFITLAFYGIWPQLLPAILGQYLIKVVIAVIDTPLVYLLVGWLKRVTGGSLERRQPGRVAKW
ncbi:MAG: queuosine precursor transporter [Bacillota bacterium]